MKNNSSGEVVRIGRFCSDATGCENLMQPIKDAFNSTCIAFLESLADTTAPWITVDEIGYLENTSYDYQKAFERLMNKKTDHYGRSKTGSLISKLAVQP